MILDQLAGEARHWRERAHDAGAPMRTLLVAARGADELGLGATMRVLLDTSLSPPSPTARRVVGTTLIGAGTGLRAERLALIFDAWVADTRAVIIADAARTGERVLRVLPYDVAWPWAGELDQPLRWGDPTDLPLGGWLGMVLDRAFDPDGFVRFEALTAAKSYVGAERDALVDLCIALHLVHQGHYARLYGAGAHLLLAERHEIFMDPRLSVRLAR